MLEYAETHVDVIYRKRPIDFRPSLWETLEAAVGLSLVNHANDTPIWLTVGEIKEETDKPVGVDTTLRRCHKLVEMGLMQDGSIPGGRYFFAPTARGARMVVAHAEIVQVK
jgi:hypothetical protein